MAVTVTIFSGGAWDKHEDERQRGVVMEDLRGFLERRDHYQYRVEDGTVLVPYGTVRSIHVSDEY